MTTRQKAERLLDLHHQPEPLVLCNAWDAASARIVEAAGFTAIATTSSGCANSLGYADGEQVPPGEMIGAIRRIARCVSVPVSADVEAGYGDPEAVTVELIEAGAVGMNLEDFVSGAMVPVGIQSSTIAKVRETADSLGVHVVINARVDVYLNEIGEPETRFEHTLERMNSYADAGADCLFLPGILDIEVIRRLVEVSPRPVNILAMRGSPGIEELASVGVKRISVGGGPMRATMGLTKQIAQTLKSGGSYDCFLDLLMPGTEANGLFDSR